MSVAAGLIAIIGVSGALFKVIRSSHPSNIETSENVVITSTESAAKENKIKYVFTDMKPLASIPDNETIKEISYEPEEKESLTIFVGDSRTVGMEQCIDDNSIYIAKVGEGYEWYDTYAKDVLEEVLEANSEKDLSVIFNLGVNDLDNADKYVSAINELAEKYPAVELSYMSVNPVTKTTVSNEQIQAFNSTIEKMLADNIDYIDTYSYLIAEGFNTVDGLHYTADTYKNIYEYAMKYGT